MTQYLSYTHLIIRTETTSIIFWGYAQLSYAFFTCGYAVALFTDNQDTPPFTELHLNFGESFRHSLKSTTGFIAQGQNDKSKQLTTPNT